MIRGTFDKGKKGLPNVHEANVLNRLLDSRLSEGGATVSMSPQIFGSAIYISICFLPCTGSVCASQAGVSKALL